MIFSLSSCAWKNEAQKHDSKELYLSWKSFNDKKDSKSCRDFISELEMFEPESFDAYPELRTQTKEQIESCIAESKKILSMIEAGEPDPISVYESGRKINLSMLSYLYNQNFVLEQTHKKIFIYFVWLVITIIGLSMILIFLNALEVKKRDKIIYNSEQFLRHSIEVQESERKRISQELHDTVAQSMRYVSLLAENLSDKDAAEKIISTQNQNHHPCRQKSS